MMTKILPQEFQVLSGYIQAISGIYLDNSKSYLIESRLSPLLEISSCSSYSELYYKAKSDPGGKLQHKIIEAITTGETMFFRDTSPFDLLQHKILPDLIDRRGLANKGKMPLRLSIWSAACSSGQEVYSIAIILKDLLGDLSKYSLRLLGTDISDEALAAASRGRYNKIEIERGLPKEKLLRFFKSEGDFWKIRDEIRSLASFKRLNLMEDFSSLARFDIIFCRNVAIYFSEQEKARLFARLAKALEPDGYLIIGSTESITSLCPQFESKRYLRSVFYQLKKPL